MFINQMALFGDDLVRKYPAMQKIHSVNGFSLDFFCLYLRICSCLACVYRVMDARGKFGEHERCVRVARGDSRVQL